MASVTNLTLSIDDKLLQAARVRAVKEGTSVNEVCRRAIESYARPQSNRLARYLALQAKVDAMPRPASANTRSISRDALYQELFAQRSVEPAAATRPRKGRG